MSEAAAEPVATESGDIEAVAPWPTPATATADAVIKHLAAISLMHSTGARLLLGVEGAAAERGDEVASKYWRDRYLKSLDVYVSAAQLAHAVVEVQVANPALAETVAVALVEGADDGGWYHEVVWDWLSDRGVEPQDLRDRAVAVVTAEIAKYEEGP